MFLDNILLYSQISLSHNRVPHTDLSHFSHAVAILWVYRYTPLSRTTVFDCSKNRSIPTMSYMMKSTGIMNDIWDRTTFIQISLYVSPLFMVRLHSFHRSVRKQTQSAKSEESAKALWSHRATFNGNHRWKMKDSSGLVGRNLLFTIIHIYICIYTYIYI